MPDTARRSALLERLRALREKAATFSERLKDERAREFVRRTVFNRLDDVERFFLADPSSRPSEAIWETMWLDNAELMLSLAEQSFSKFESQVAAYGGPENVKLVG
jgi:hypothetical protein